MPAYEYVCKDCNHEITVFLTIKEYEAKPKIKCPHCQSDNVQKKISAFTAKTSKKSQFMWTNFFLNCTPQETEGITQLSIAIHHFLSHLSFAALQVLSSTIISQMQCIIIYDQYSCDPVS